MNSDIVFVVMLGAAVWTSLQLSTGPRGFMRQLTLSKLGQIAATEGLVCAIVWCAINIVIARSFTIEVLAYSLLVGSIWALFTLIARLPFSKAVASLK